MKRISYLIVMVAGLFIVACGDGDESPDPCALLIEVSIETTGSEAASGTGTAIITAGGGNGGLTYSLNQGAAQAGLTFSNLEAGQYSLVVEDRVGCTRTITFNINEI